MNPNNHNPTPNYELDSNNQDAPSYNDEDCSNLPSSNDLFHPFGLDSEWSNLINQSDQCLYAQAQINPNTETQTGNINHHASGLTSDPPAQDLGLGIERWCGLDPFDFDDSNQTADMNANFLTQDYQHLYQSPKTAAQAVTLSYFTPGSNKSEDKLMWDSQKLSSISYAKPTQQTQTYNVVKQEGVHQTGEGAIASTGQRTTETTAHPTWLMETPAIQQKVRRGKRSRDESLDEGSPLHFPVKTGCREYDEKESKHTKRIKYTPEKPRYDAEHPWVRPNGGTKGLSSRTGKINQYDPVKDGGYMEMGIPFDPWRSSNRHSYSYNWWGELAKSVMSTEEVHDFIYEHPENDSHLILWIQKTGADSAKRYSTQNAGKCRFKNCPEKICTRAIAVGSLRVAFDERWALHGAKHNPYNCTGFVHLYCMERFLDFCDICRKFDVRVDDRRLPSEPNGRYASSLEHHPGCNAARTFIDACKEGRLEQAFPGYPMHDPDACGAEKPHQKTLTYYMTRKHVDHMETSRKGVLSRRKLAPSQMIVSVGDLEMAVKAKSAMKAKGYKTAGKNKRRYGAAKAHAGKEADGDSEEDAPHDKKEESSIDHSTAGMYEQCNIGYITPPIAQVTLDPSLARPELNISPPSLYPFKQEGSEEWWTPNHCTPQDPALLDKPRIEEINDNDNYNENGCTKLASLHLDTSFPYFEFPTSGDDEFKIDPSFFL